MDSGDIRIMILPVVLLAFLLIQTSRDPFPKESHFLRTSVVEFQPFPVSRHELERSPLEYMTRNVIKMEKYVKEARAEGSKIIVFPEYGLTHMKASDLFPEFGPGISQVLPSTLPESISLCHKGSLPSTQRILQRISCIALNNNMIIIVNLITMETIHRESGNQSVFYNTNVAFDELGRIKERYRKFHLYNEPLISPPEVYDISFFDTDIGVRIGMIICFDILNEEPIKSIMSNGVDILVYPTLWFNELPFLSGLSIHSGVAIVTGLDILSSCYYDPKKGVTGSGIYSWRDGIKASTWNQRPTIVNGILGTRNGSSTDLLELEQWRTPHFLKENLSTYEFERINLEEKENRIDRKGVNCQLKYLADPYSFESPSEGYALIGRMGLRAFGHNYVRGIQVCGVVYCRDYEDPSTCGERRSPSEEGPTFTRMEVNGIFKENVIPYPVSLDAHFYPIQGAKYGRSGEQKFFHSIREPISGLISFGLYGRIYSMDPKI